MTTSTTAISSSKLDSLASRLSSVSTSLIKSYGEQTHRQVLSHIPLMTHRTFSKINSSTLLTSFIPTYESCFGRWVTQPKNSPLRMALLYALVHHCAHLLYNIFTSQSSVKYAPSIRKERVKLLVVH